MKEFSRTDRVADQIQREIASLLHREIKDPRLKFTTVAHVDLSKDLRIAKVYVTFMEDNDQKEIKLRLKLLANAAGFLRTALAKSIRMRSVPELKFIYDDSLRRGRNLSSLIDSAIASDRANKSSEDGDGDAEGHYQSSED